MSDRYFLDTNIFVYSLDPVDPRKARIAEELVTRGVASRLGVISYQVVQEFMNVSLRQFRATMTVTELELYFFNILLPMMTIPSSSGLFLEALRLQTGRSDLHGTTPSSSRLLSKAVARFFTAKTCNMADASGTSSSKIRFFRQRANRRNLRRSVQRHPSRI